jgi:hypothetical protein
LVIAIYFVVLCMVLAGALLFRVPGGHACVGSVLGAGGCSWSGSVGWECRLIRGRVGL